jgi:AraC-like DNA-binding protein
MEVPVVDPVSEMLRTVRLTGAFFYMGEGGGAWSVGTVAARELTPRILPDAAHLISFHVLLDGECWAGGDGLEPVHMRPGDVVVLPHGDVHVMASDERAISRPGSPVTMSRRYRETVLLGPGPVRDTRLVCGFLGCDLQPHNPLIASLPRMLHMPGVAHGWLARMPEQVVAETRTSRLGSDTALVRMAELMFIEVLRRHVEHGAPRHDGWLAALGDPVVGGALALMHERPAHAWTLAELARAVASSRTVLAERFAQLMGVAPMAYLTRWRLQLAADALATGTAKVAAIGASVGYDSEAAFSRAFKRGMGVSPGAWRRKTMAR